MSSKAHIKSIQNLLELRNGFTSLRNEIQETVDCAKQEVDKLLAWIEQKELFWKRKIEQCQERIRQAEINRQNWLGNNDNWILKEANLYNQRNKLQKAQEEFRNVQYWKHKLEHASSAFKRQSYDMLRYFSQDLPRTKNFLEKAYQTLNQYLSTVHEFNQTERDNYREDLSDLKPNQMDISKSNEFKTQIEQNHEAGSRRDEIV